MNEEKDADRAFRDAENLEFDGKRLNNFSVTRQRAAIKLGMRWRTGKLAPDEIRSIANPQFRLRVEAEEELAKLVSLKKKGSPKHRQRVGELEHIIAERKDAPESMPDYDGLDEDAAIVVYVMTLADSKCHEIRRQSPEVCVGRFDAWSERNGLGPGGYALPEAKAIFFTVASQIMATDGKPEYDTGGSASEEDDPN